MIEIERKFLVKTNSYAQDSMERYRIAQGYLNSNPERTVRVRIQNDQAYLTVKGSPSESGMSRYEWEKEISVEEAEELIKLCEPEIIDKTRFIVFYKDSKFEVDEFYGVNEGLTIAEIELPSEDAEFSKPEWLGKEVTGDIRYYNSQLSKNGYKNW